MLNKKNKKFKIKKFKKIIPEKRRATLILKKDDSSL